MKANVKLTLSIMPIDEDLEICCESNKRSDLEKRLSDMFSIDENCITVIENPTLCRKRHFEVEILSSEDSKALAAIEFFQYFFKNHRPIERKIEFKRI